MVSCEDLTGREITSECTQVFVGRIQSRMGCWSDSLSSLLLVGQTLTVPCHEDLSPGQVTPWPFASLRMNKEVREGSPKWKPYSFKSTFESDITLHLLYSIY